jgi:hypothetical protein
MRKFQETFPSLNTHLLSKYDCDVFIHTWDKMGYWSAYKSDATQGNTQTHIPVIEQLYKPKKMIVEDSGFVEELKAQGNVYAPHLMREPKHVGHMASMFYKIWAANEVRKFHERETGTQYDWVVRVRPDLIFHAPINMPLAKTPGKAYISRQQCSPGWLNDQFAIALPNDMDLYSSFFFHMEEYFRARNEFYPEKFMDWSMRKKGLTPEMWDLHFSILR